MQQCSKTVMLRLCRIMLDGFQPDMFYSSRHAVLGTVLVLVFVFTMSLVLLNVVRFAVQCSCVCQCCGSDPASLRHNSCPVCMLPCFPL